MMQPLSGLHVASLIDPAKFDVRLHHEDWHGPFEISRATGYDIVFLTGLQVDFDRMRQLSYFFRRAGATVIAGGSICTLFPEFARQFFDSVCSGGVECVRDVISDFEQGRLKPIYRSPIGRIGTYSVDYGLFTKSGISPIAHLLEASRGCTFRCEFCLIPAEVGQHAVYDLSHIKAAIDRSIATSPVLSFRRWYPLVLFMDNNFSDNREHMLRVCELMRNHRRVRGWAALVTQNIIHDRALIKILAQSKCISLFVGLESFDQDLLRRYNKKQNLSRRQNVIDDIAFAESQGIGIGYGYLFDPREQTAEAMRSQVEMIARNPRLPMPIYMSVVAPLAGTATFWADLKEGRLAANLRLRDLDGETIAYARLSDSETSLVQFVEQVFRRPWVIAGRKRVLWKTLRRIMATGSLNPIRWYYLAASNLHCFVWSTASKTSGTRTYLAGTDALDPQYFERPEDLSEADRERYFDPIALTDAEGHAAEWLRPYLPNPDNRPRKNETHSLREGSALRAMKAG